MTLSDYQRPEINSANGQLLRQFSLGERFQRIFQRNLWHGTESISGPGSSQTETAVIRRELPLLLQRLGSQVLLDAPCGDAFWISRCGLPLTYIGVDIVPDLIADLSNKVSSGALTGRFLVADITHTPLPEADTILCRDCLVHLSFQNISNALENFRRTGAEWIVTTVFTDLSRNADCEDGDWRPLNFEQAPFHWPRPAEILVEECSLGNGGWRDKSLGIWKMNDIPGVTLQPKD